MHFLDLPAEIRTDIYHHLYNSIIIHPCTIPPSAHEPQYPPHSHIPCIPKYEGKITQLYITAYSTQDDTPTRSSNNNNASSNSATHSAIRIPTSILTSLHRTCRLTHCETTTLLSTTTFRTINLDIYSVNDILAHTHLLPPPLQPHFARLTRLDLNVQYYVKHLALAMTTAYRDGPMLLDMIWSPLNDFVDPALQQSCQFRTIERLNRSLGGFEGGKRKLWAPGLERVRVLFGRRPCEEVMERMLPTGWRESLDWLREMGDGIEVEAVFWRDGI